MTDRRRQCDSIIDRRDFANALAIGLVGSSIIASAQPTRRLPVLGVLTPNADARGRTVAALVKGLRELEYVEGRDFAFEFRFAAGRPADFPGLAAELVSLKVDVIYAIGPAALTAAAQATRVMPIVALDLESDPIQAGWARTLARPGGNVTGMFLDIPGMAGKWLELLQTVAPGIRRTGLLWDSTTGSAQRVAAEAAAQGFGIEAQVMEVSGSDGIDAALRAGVGAGINAIVVLGSPDLSRVATNKLIADFAAAKRLPAIAPFRWFAEAGGLLSYGVNYEDFYPRAGSFVVRVLKGARPGDLAIERPSKFELAVNRKTARALGLTIPQALLLRADEVIQ
ncbi:ABC transporter substrate-binding protein [Variovorax sp. GT1P44]|uniref:ABC transporter substrate-binding protein n=1 Tax=Variovorax sp. GT1P44 TaxID=3443742 RepID=UPI003F472442